MIHPQAKFVDNVLLANMSLQFALWNPVLMRSLLLQMVKQFGIERNVFQMFWNKWRTVVVLMIFLFTMTMHRHTRQHKQWNKPLFRIEAQWASILFSKLEVLTWASIAVKLFSCYSYLPSIESHKDFDIRIVNLFDKWRSSSDSFLGTMNWLSVVSKLHIIRSINECIVCSIPVDSGVDLSSAFHGSRYGQQQLLLTSYADVRNCRA